MKSIHKFALMNRPRPFDADRMDAHLSFKDLVGLLSWDGIGTPACETSPSVPEPSRVHID